MIKKDFRHDYYKGLKGIYFYKIIQTIIEMGDLKRPGLKILDFGAGVGKLKTILGKTVTNHDIIPELSEIKDWTGGKFDYVVANEVFELMTPALITAFLKDLKKMNPKVKLIAGISRQTLVNNFLSLLGGEPDAHVDTVTFPKNQINTLLEKMTLVSRKSVFGLCDVYLFEFKK